MAELEEKEELTTTMAKQNAEGEEDKDKVSVKDDDKPAAEIITTDKKMDVDINPAGSGDDKVMTEDKQQASSSSTPPPPTETTTPTFATLVPVLIEPADNPPPPPQPEVKTDDLPSTSTSMPTSTSSSSVDSTIAAVISASLEFGKENSSLDLEKKVKVKKKKSASPSSSTSTSGRGKSNSNKVFKSGTSSAKNKSVRNAKGKLGVGEKRGRKTKEWYVAAGKEPGFSKLKRSKKVWDDWDEPTFVSTKGDSNKAKGVASKATEGGGGTVKNLASGTNVTTKELLDVISLDHNYCQVLYSMSRSKVQPFRHIFGPKDEYKAKFYPESLISPNKYLPPLPILSFPPLPPPPLPMDGPLPPPQAKSKLEYLLKGGSTTVTPCSSPLPQRILPTPVKRYWDVHQETDEDLDVVTVVPGESPGENVPYDTTKARNLMLQCDKHSQIIKTLEGEDDWEDQILRTGWTPPQNKLFDAVIAALHAEHLARLAYVDLPAEPILRRCSLDKTTQRVRSALTHVLWKTHATQWLHSVLLENLNQTYLSIYLDVLQTLKAIAPSLVDKMIVLSTAPVKEGRHEEAFSAMEELSDPDRTLQVLSTISDNVLPTPAVVAEGGNADAEGAAATEIPATNVADTLKQVLVKKATHLSAISADALTLLLKKPWDPFSPVVHLSKIKKLSSSPVFLWIPCVTPANTPTTMRRFKNFVAMLGVLGKVFQLNIIAARCSSVTKFAQNLLAMTKSKIFEIRKTFPDKPLFLIGWGTGSILATTASVTHPVDGVIAMSFPLFGLAGPRGTLEDNILEMKKPVLFVIGGRALDVTLTEIELLRKQLSCESSLVIVGCGDKNLRISRYHRERLLTTQSYVDKCLIDEISYFINLHSRHQHRAYPVRGVVVRKEPVWTTPKGPPPIKKRVSSGAVSTTSPIKISSPIKAISSSSPVSKLATPVSAVLGEDSNSNASSSSSSIVPITPTPMAMPIPSSSHSFSTDFLAGGGTTGVTLTPTATVAAAPKKRKQSGAGDGSGVKKPRGEKKKKLSGGLQDADRKMAIKSDPPAPTDYVSPVLNYLGATPGQGGLLHNLLSPTNTPKPVVLNIPTPSSTTPGVLKTTKKPARPKSTPAAKKFTPLPPLPTPPQSQLISDLPVITVPSASTPSQGQGPPPAPSTILAGGATATPVPGPVIPAFTSVDSMRQYVMQHQHVMQRHLQTIQQSSPNSPQLLRLLSPQGQSQGQGQTHLSHPIYSSSSLPSSAPYAAPSMDSSLPSTRIDAGNVGLPSDVNVTLIKPQEGQSQGQGVNLLPPRMPAYMSTPTPTPRPIYHQSILRPPPMTTTTTTTTTFRSGVGMPMPVLGEGAQANVVFKTADKTIHTTLSTEDVKSLFAGGVLRCNVPGESMPVNIVLKSQLPVVSTHLPSGATFHQQQGFHQAATATSLVRPTVATPSSGTISIAMPTQQGQQSAPIMATGGTSTAPQFPIITGIKSLAQPAVVVTTMATATTTTPAQIYAKKSSPGFNPGPGTSNTTPTKEVVVVVENKKIVKVKRNSGVVATTTPAGAVAKPGGEKTSTPATKRKRKASAASESTTTTTPKIKAKKKKKTLQFDSPSSTMGICASPPGPLSEVGTPTASPAKVTEMPSSSVTSAPIATTTATVSSPSQPVAKSDSAPISILTPIVKSSSSKPTKTYPKSKRVSGGGGSSGTKKISPAKKMSPSKKAPGAKTMGSTSSPAKSVAIPPPPPAKTGSPPLDQEGSQAAPPPDKKEDVIIPPKSSSLVTPDPESSSTPVVKQTGKASSSSSVTPDLESTSVKKATKAEISSPPTTRNRKKSTPSKPSTTTGGKPPVVKKKKKSTPPTTTTITSSSSSVTTTTTTSSTTTVEPIATSTISENAEISAETTPPPSDDSPEAPPRLTRSMRRQSSANN